MAEDNKKQEELLELLRRQNEESGKQAEYLDRRNKSIASAIEQYKILLEQATTASAKRDYELKISELIEASAENRLETLEEEQAALNEKIQNLEKILDDEEEMAKLGKERADTLRKSVALLKQERAVLDQTVPLEKRKRLTRFGKTSIRKHTKYLKRHTGDGKRNFQHSLGSYCQYNERARIARCVF